MNIVESIILSLTLLGSSATTNGNGFSLVKRNELYLFRPKIVGLPVLKGLNIRPLFSRLPGGEIFMVELGGAQKVWGGYFFSPEGDVERMIMIPSGTKNPPRGIISAPFTVFGNSSVGFGIYDNSKRLSLFDAYGKLQSSIALPVTIDSGRVTDVVYDKNKLIAATRNVQTNYPSITVVDYQSTPVKSFSIQLCKDMYSQAEKKGSNAGAFIDPVVNILPSGVVAFNLSISPEINLITKDGKLISNKTTPDHFRSFLNAENFDDSWFSYDSNGCISQKAEEWFKTWTHSYPVYELSNNRLVVPRVLYPIFNLDLYSYSDKEIKYLGYVSTEKEFLYADTTGVYLLEDKDDTSIIVGKYEVVAPGFAEDREHGWSTIRLTAEQLAGIHKVAPDTSKSDTCKPCDKEKLKPKGYSNTIDSIRLISADSIEYSLKGKLAPDKDHVIVFGGISDCALYFINNATYNYVKNKTNVDLTVVLSSPYASELEEGAKLASIDWKYPILTNLDYNRLNPILKSSVCFLVVSKDGTITASAEYPNFAPKPRGEE